MQNKVTIPASLVVLSLSLLIATAANQGSVSISDIPLFGFAVALSFIIQWIVFIPSFLNKTEHFFDLTGSLTFISVVLITLMLIPEIYVRDIVIALLVVIWATRLGSFLFLRVRKDGGDGRFTIMKTKFWWFLMTWNIQGMWVFLSLAAGLAAMTSAEKVEVDIFLIFGLVVWVLGFSIEVISDGQKSKFRSKTENKDKFITSGIWSWSRHPNYFGEILLWCGITIIALPVLQGWQFITLISPIFIIILLTQISGVRLLELRGKKKWGENEEYRKYLRNTSVLIPLPPKK
ncbi:MAG: DUF1295 domain-containing protein [Gammaproteobacteria bacterium]|tara:strand:+ start:34 stop:903 length:870 start_codon:yes stop_codon:yes gene_type:complete